jgi:enamine deaminase RidA (YjgF/YER057c/UK114 family)
MERKLVSSGAIYEPKIGFSRAVRVGPHIAVSGTAPIAPGGGVACPDDMYGQTKRCLEIIQKAIEDAGGRLEHVVRTRVYLKDMSRWEEAGRAHGEVFKDIRPASTMIQIVQAIDAHWLVEIEADAIVS